MYIKAYLLTGKYEHDMFVPKIVKWIFLFSCEICSKEFKYKVNYDYHMKNHNNNRSFKCSFCTKTCLSKWDLKVHMRSHTDGRPYSCEICGEFDFIVLYVQNERFPVI